MSKERNPEDCYRTACDRPHDGCEHADTGHMYCSYCAVKINRANEDYARKNGRDLVDLEKLRARKRAEMAAQRDEDAALTHMLG